MAQNCQLKQHYGIKNNDLHKYTKFVSENTIMYKCNYCEYFNNKLPKVERHRNNKKIYIFLFI